MSDIDFTSAPQPGLQPLPVLATARETLTLLGRFAPDLKRLALPAFLAIFLLSPLAIIGGPAWRFFLLGVEFFVVVWFATAVFRLALLGPGQAGATSYPLWSERELRVFGRLLGLALIAFLACLPPIAIFGSLSGAFEDAEPQLGAWILVPALVMLLAALACVFAIPAAAVGQGYGFGQAWRDSKDVLPQLLGLVLVTILPLDLLLQLGTQIFALLARGTGLFVPYFAYSVAADLLHVAVISLLVAAAFARRRGWTGTSLSTT